MSRISVTRLAAALALSALAFASCEKAREGGGASSVNGDEDAPRPALAGKVELIELFAAWNPACRMQAPVTGALAKEYEGLARIRRIDVEADPEALERYGVGANPPAFVLLVEGEVARRMTGLQSAEEIRAALDEALSGRPNGGRRSAPPAERPDGGR